MNAAALIELEGISRRYKGQGGASTVALRDVSLRLHAGEFVCITGPSGSGKSTLMHVLGCLDSPDSGLYRLAGREVSDLGGDGLAWLRRHFFGFVFQSYNLLASATAAENVELPAVYAGLARKTRRSRAIDLLAAFGLEARTSHRPAALSGGEQQRVSIARALMNGGRVVLADEPTGALDRKNGDEVLRMLEVLAHRGHTVVLITHSPEVAARGGRHIQLLGGRIVADSGPSPEYRNCLPEADAPAIERVSIGAGARAIEWLRSGVVSLRANLLRTRRVRAVLSVFCIMLGVWSVATLLMIAEGAYRQTVQQVYRLGADQFDVHAAAANALTMEDAATIAAQVPNVRHVAPEFSQRMTVRRGAANMRANVESILPKASGPPNGSEFRVLSKGGTISERDNEHREQVALIGSGIERQLFSPGVDAVDRYLLIGNVPFKVKGVLSGPNSTAMERNWRADGDSDVVLIPFRTAAALLHGTDKPQLLSVFVEDAQKMGQTVAEVREILIRRHGGANFRFDFNPDRARRAGETRRQLWLGFGSLGGIALLVGGMGVMAIMLMSVKERTREIGIRMAAGARRRDIMQQFVIEAAVLATVGGVLGVAACIATGPLLRLFDFPAVFAPEIALAALAFSMATGVIFGVVPARRASGLDPVAALRTAE